MKNPNHLITRKELLTRKSHPPEGKKSSYKSQEEVDLCHLDSSIRTFREGLPLAISVLMTK